MARPRNGDARKRSSSPRLTSARDRDPSELCLQCGLCCDGTLFNSITLLPDEGRLVESLGLEVREDRDKRIVAPQPCPAFRDGCCSLYEQGRPQMCHTYTCGVLNGYVGGSTSLDDSLAVIGLVRSLVREIEIEAGLPLGSHDRETLNAYLREHEPWTSSTEHARLLIAYFRYHLLGQQYFGFVAMPSEAQAAAAGERLATEGAEAD